MKCVAYGDPEQYVQVPLMVQPRSRAPGRAPGTGADEVATAEQFRLRLLLEEGGGHQRVRGAEAVHPAGRRAAADERHADAQEGVDPEFVAAVATGDQNPVETVAGEAFVEVFSVEAAFLRLGLPVDKLGDHRLGSRQYLCRGETGLRRSGKVVLGGAHGCGHWHAPPAADERAGQM
jgi:hypothetical protein